MDEIERRRTAVRLRQEGHTTAAVATELGRSERWVRKWTARHEAAEQGDDWAQSRSRAPHANPTETDPTIVKQVLAVRAVLEANPQSQIGALAIAWPALNSWWCNVSARIGRGAHDQRRMTAVSARQISREACDYACRAAVRPEVSPRLG